MRGAGLMVLAFLAYRPIWRGGFIWDDSVMVTGNLMLRSARGLRDFWITTNAVDPLPLTMSALWLQWQLWDGHALGYHIVNVLAHGLGAVLFWRVLRHFTRHERLAWLAAAVFALHPVAVASAAWISEQKNTLSLIFYFLSILCWLRWAEGGGRGGHWWALFFYLGALLAKGSVVMLPVVLLLIAWWRKGRVERADFWRLAPFFILSIVSGLATIWIQKHKAFAGAMGQELNWPARIAAAAWAVWFYLWKTLVPLRLGVVYPNWNVSANSIIDWLPALALAAVFAICWRYRKGWGRHVLLGLGCFVVTLFPVMGLFDMYFLVYTRVADHWQYLALPPLLGLAVCGGGHLLLRAFGKRRPLLLTFACVALACLFAATWARAAIYANERTLWADAVEKNPQAWMAWNNLGNALDGNGEADAAMADYEKALAIHPGFADAESNLGNALVAKGRPADAILHLQKAVEAQPAVGRFYFNYGVGLGELNRLDEAAAQYKKALELHYNPAQVHNNLSGVLYRQNKFGDALEEARQAAQLQPDLAEPYLNAAKALAELGRTDEAAQDFETHLRMRPDNAGAHFEYGALLATHGHLDLALPHFQAVVRLRPDDAAGHCDLGNTLAGLKRLPEAIAEFRTALRLQPDNAETRNNLALALCQQGAAELGRGRRDNAMAQFREASQLKPDNPGIKKMIDDALR